jgi:hypothetical protein
VVISAHDGPGEGGGSDFLHVVGVNTVKGGVKVSSPPAE